MIRRRSRSAQPKPSAPLGRPPKSTPGVQVRPNRRPKDQNIPFLRASPQQQRYPSASFLQRADLVQCAYQPPSPPNPKSHPPPPPPNPKKKKTSLAPPKPPKPPPNPTNPTTHPN